MPQWLMYKLINPLPICKISYLPRHDNSGGNTPRDCPKSYKFEGSNNGITFETIFSVHDDQACVPGVIVTKSFVNEKAFKFYRLFFLDVPGRNNGKKFVVLGDVQFFGHLGESRGVRFRACTLIILSLIILDKVIAILSDRQFGFVN